MPWFTDPWLIPVGVVVGFAVGAIFGGGRMVRVYDWDTEWNIDAPLPDVYRIWKRSLKCAWMAERAFAIIGMCGCITHCSISRASFWHRFFVPAMTT